MKPSIGFFITCFVIMGFVMINFAIQSIFVKKTLSSKHNQIMMYGERIKEFKDTLKSNPDEVVTKKDLADFTEMNFYQSQIDKLYMEINLKNYNMFIPDFFILILLGWLSFQLDKIYKQINKQAE